MEVLHSVSKRRMKFRWVKQRGWMSSWKKLPYYPVVPALQQLPEGPVSGGFACDAVKKSKQRRCKPLFNYPLCDTCIYISFTGEGCRQYLNIFSSNKKWNQPVRLLLSPENVTPGANHDHHGLDHVTHEQKFYFHLNPVTSCWGVICDIKLLHGLQMLCKPTTAYKVSRSLVS